MSNYTLVAWKCRVGRDWYATEHDARRAGDGVRRNLDPAEADRYTDDAFTPIAWPVTGSARRLLPGTQLWQACTHAHVHLGLYTRERQAQTAVADAAHTTA